MVTLIADNYFGYCKKEVKTQISYAANLSANAEEEHAGGALVFPSFDLGEDFQLGRSPSAPPTTLRGCCRGSATGRSSSSPRATHSTATTPTSSTCRRTSRSDLARPVRHWTRGGETRKPDLLARLDLRAAPPATRSRCNQARTRGGAGGWSAPAERHLLPQAVHRLRRRQVRDLQVHRRRDHHRPGVRARHLREDFEWVDAILARDYSDRFRDPARHGKDSRPILSERRSLGSVIKLLTPSATEFSDAYNAWVAAIPEHVKDLVVTVKRFHKPDWGGRWRERFSVDTIDGRPGHELRYRNRMINTQYLRVGYLPDGSWRIFNLRKDFMPAEKLSAGGRHHRLGGHPAGDAAAAPTGIPAAEREILRQLREPVLPAPRRRDRPRLRQARRNRTQRAGQLSSPTTSRSTGTRRAARLPT
jgi:phosphoenolpyruvate carboxykinase (diphosphate)